VDLGVLGVVEARRDGAPVQLSRKERTVLAALALRRPAIAPAEWLCDGVWRDIAPKHPDKALQTIVLRVRRALGKEVIVTDAAGYALGPSVDVDRDHFEAAVLSDRELPIKVRIKSLSEALLGWRGMPFEDLGDWEPAEAMRFRLEELRRVAEEHLAALQLEAGRRPSIVAELEALVAAEPFREQRWLLLADALARAGRTAEAFRVIERARIVMREELGTDIGYELETFASTLHRAAEDRSPTLEQLRAAAGRASADGDVESAAGLLADAIAIAGTEGVDLRTRSDLSSEFGTAQSELGRIAPALDAYTAAADFARRSGDARRSAIAALAAARVGSTSGLDASAPVVALLTQALEQLSNAPTALRARVLAALAVAEAYTRPAAEAGAHAADALTIARLLADPEVLAAALHAVLATTDDPADIERRRALVDELVLVAADQGLDQWHRRVLPLQARLLALEGDVAGADAALSHLEELARPPGDAVGLHLSSHRALLRATVWGDVADARNAIAAVRTSADAAVLDPAAAQLAEFGQQAFVDALFDCGGPLPPAVAGTWPLPTMHAIACGLTAARLAASGDAATARAQLERIGVDELANLPRDLYWLAMVWAMTKGCAAVGDSARAAVLYDVAAPFAHLFLVDTACIFLGSMHHHLAVLAATTGRTRAARDHLEQAAAAHTAIGSAVWSRRSAAELER
jgi:DNA-binding SARP family transcriptional activator